MLPILFSFGQVFSASGRLCWRFGMRSAIPGPKGLSDRTRKELIGREQVRIVSRWALSQKVVLANCHTLIYRHHAVSLFEVSTQRSRQHGGQFLPGKELEPTAKFIRFHRSHDAIPRVDEVWSASIAEYAEATAGHCIHSEDTTDELVGR